MNYLEKGVRFFMGNLKAIQDKIQGPVFSILTPFREDNENIDYDSLEKYLNYSYESGAKNFFVMAYNSRYSQLSWDEIKELNSFVAKTVKALNQENLVIVADPLHCSTKVSVEFAQHAQEVGADVISIICRERYYFDDQVFNHYKMINDNSDIGILVHEMPFLNGLGGPSVNWPITLLDRVADLDHVIAIKEDAKDDEYSNEVINTLKDRLAIVISGGGKSQWLRFADKGCQAWLNGIGVFEPKLAINFWKFYKDNQIEKCHSMLREIEEPFFEHGVRKFGWHLTIKAALEHRGHMSRKDRLPLQELPEAEAKEIYKLIDSLPIDKYI